MGGYFERPSVLIIQERDGKRMRRASWLLVGENI